MNITCLPLFLWFNSKVHFVIDKESCNDHPTEMVVQICSNDYFLKFLQRELLAEEILRVYDFLGFPGDASRKEPTCQCRRHRRRGFDPWVGKIPWRRRIRQPIPIFWPRESPWTEEPGKLQSTGSQRVRYD